jgi:AraC-like DNA-binding protein
MQLKVRPDDIPRPLVTQGPAVLVRGDGIATHQHHKAQLLLVESGLVGCEVDRALWIVQPCSALWIPSLAPHRVSSTTPEAHVCFIFVEPHAASALPAQCCTYTLSPLLEGLLQRALQLPLLYDLEGPEGRLAQVLIDQLHDAHPERIAWPMPADAKLRKIAARLLAHPDERVPVAEWGRRVGAAERTVSRLLQRETRMSFGRWRRQLHVAIALQRLAQGVTVQTVALDLGYHSASAFITMFRKTLGASPTRYLAERDRGA